MSSSRPLVAGRPSGPAVAVVGPGAIGTTMAAALHEVGRTPIICGRSARDHLELRVGEESVVVPGPVLVDPFDGPPGDGRAVDLVLLAVKSTQVEAAAAWLKKLCGAETVVCVLQNGVEHRSVVQSHLPGACVLPAVVWFPAQTQPDGSVRLRGPARLTVPATPTAGIVVECLRGTRCTVEVTADFTSVAWRKLLQNAVSGLMALSGRRAGMFHRDDMADLSLAYLRECLQVARAEGAVLSDEVPQEIMAALRASPPDLGTSILTDREAGRPMEWDIRNGVVRRRARRHGISTPISDVVVPLLAAAGDGPG